MRIQINTDGSIQDRERLAAHFQGVLESALARFQDRLTHVEVHLSSETGDRTGRADKRCMIEARLHGCQPTAVTHQAAALDQAVDGAVDKLKRSLESVLGREQRNR